MGRWQGGRDRPQVEIIQDGRKRGGSDNDSDRLRDRQTFRVEEGTMIDLSYRFTKHSWRADELLAADFEPFLKSGIYGIRCRPNGRWYVGASKNIYRRLNTHWSDLKCQINDERLLYRDARKYGRDEFEFFILEECLIDDLSHREQFWIDKLNSRVAGYNNQSSFPHRNWKY